MITQDRKGEFSLETETGKKKVKQKNIVVFSDLYSLLRYDTEICVLLYNINAVEDMSSTEILPPLIPMMVPRRPTGTEKFSLTFTTRSNRRNSASRSGMTPCCCSKG